MIPQTAIDAWRPSAPWSCSSMVEHDLALSRALVDIFRVPALAAALALRGGTALHKLHLRPASRDTKDIDLVQMTPEPIGPTLDRLRAVLDPWLGTPRRPMKTRSVGLIYSFASEEDPSRDLRLKIKINTRTHASLYGLEKLHFDVRSGWFDGAADVTTFHLDELIGTKLRALYQRANGRDLFDIALALDRGADPDRVAECFTHTMAMTGSRVTRAQFERNLHLKRAKQTFHDDVTPLLPTGVGWNPDRAWDHVLTELVARLPGKPWAGRTR